jgi:glyceraldehyde 3-phosphate dehydrogenase
MINVAINGYGRIGRNVLRAFYERPELRRSMRLVAINDLGSPEMNAHLTQYDTTHGRFAQSVSAEGNYMLVGSDRIHIFAERDPQQLPWGEL